jgi:hypothetical protein
VVVGVQYGPVEDDVTRLRRHDGERDEFLRDGCVGVRNRERPLDGCPLVADCVVGSVEFACRVAVLVQRLECERQVGTRVCARSNRKRVLVVPRPLERQVEPLHDPS